ncbi:30S ribosomal protein S6 [Candidatus Babeliales bacterium]|nr:30S ribosomal protein S6 [Candidatus Babeliales bacterium]
MLRYETLMLAHPDLNDADAGKIENQINDIISGGNGKIFSFDKWGKYKLSYPVKRHSYGVYLLARYELPEDTASQVLKDLQLFFKIKVNDIIFREVFKKLDAGDSLDYMKPEPVEGGGARVPFETRAKVDDTEPKKAEEEEKKSDENINS